MIRLIIPLIVLCVLGSVAAVGFGFLGRIHPAFDTFAHFRMHFAVCLIFAFFILIFSRFKWIALLGLLVGAYGIYQSQIGYAWSAVTNNKIDGQAEYSMLHLNLLWTHENPEPVVNWVQEQDADLLSFAELSNVWEPYVVQLHETWPYILHCPEHGKRGGVRIYSKWPMDFDSQYCGVYGTFGKVQVTTPANDVFTVGSLHLRWPWPASGPKQLNSLVPNVEKLEKDALIAGDFNATPWSQTVQKFARVGALQVVPGIGPSWLFQEIPSWVTQVIGLPIDQVLHKGRLHILSAEKLEHVGSDHFPIMVRFQIAP